ncbi:M20/M25/M40 family metallo-hydrolase [Shewanella algae]|uniref:M20/M25/M40 family metallo-hydrolase n=1 Tax=Shewanella algae TaxID=38313 RepID=UPI001FBB80B5|nr:M20/M25/M40 family metallo-hydrolase [Shewanella algae]
MPMTLSIHPPLWALSIRSPLWALLLILPMLAAGCSSSPERCGGEIQLSWAETKQLQQDVEVLASPRLQGRRSGTQGATLSREYLTERFEQIGLQPLTSVFPPLAETLSGFQHSFNYVDGFADARGINLLGWLPAAQPTTEWRLLIAHYDHLGDRGSGFYPGADDNASGVAALLAIARRVKQAPSRYNLLFIASDAEEPGLYGSKALVSALQQSGFAEHISLAVNLDMIGRPGLPYAIYLEGSRYFHHYDDFSAALMAGTGLCIRPSHPRPIGRSVQRTDWLRASDHYPFHQAGIPWLYFGVPAHAQYHTRDDTADRLDYPFIGAVAEAAEQLLRLPTKQLQNR